MFPRMGSTKVPRVISEALTGQTRNYDESEQEATVSHKKPKLMVPLYPTPKPTEMAEMNIPELNRSQLKLYAEGESHSSSTLLPQAGTNTDFSVPSGSRNDKDVIDWKPPHWEEVLQNIREMRKNRDAPVDSMGCEKCSSQDSSPELYRFHVLVSLLLSSQTKDKVTFSAMEKLKEHGLTIESILQTSVADIQSMIYPVGFYKRKAEYLKKTAEILKTEYNNDIPSNVEDLCRLPGIGPKMAYLCMDIAWNKLSGIGVDTHVHRISNRLGWTRKPTKTPEDTRMVLESWLPREVWREVNLLMVGFGQQICLPVNPNCANCLNRLKCPSSKCKEVDF